MRKFIRILLITLSVGASLFLAYNIYNYYNTSKKYQNSQNNYALLEDNIKNIIEENTLLEEEVTKLENDNQEKLKLYDLWIRQKNKLKKIMK